MIWTLQRKTLIPVQIIGYAITLIIGISIALTTVVGFLDIKPILDSESEVLNDNAVIVSKKISALQSVNKQSIYFTKGELKEFEEEPFVKNISFFNKATNFKISLRPEGVPFSTEMFFESIPDRFLDNKITQDPDWQWYEGSEFLPIVIPESYLQLYNLGFAESQNLPVFSEEIVSNMAKFTINIKGKDTADFRSGILGFSKKINTILVPESFLNWANKEFGNHQDFQVNRLLVEFNDPNDERIIKYIEDKNYIVNREKLERNKLTFFFKLSFLFVFIIAIVIVLLSISFILISINLIFHKNKEVLRNLYNLGYNNLQISTFYNIVISGVTFVSVILSIILTTSIRGLYAKKLVSFFDIELDHTIIYIISFAIILILLFSLNIIILRRVKKIIINFV